MARRSETATPRACNVCGGALKPKLERVVDPQTLETFAILQCERCELGHTHPQPDDLGRYYGAAYHGGRHGLTARYCNWRRLRFLGSLPRSQNPRLLDIGCGDGVFLEAAAKKGYAVYGSEMNPKLARGRGFTVFDDLEHAAAEAPYGCITMWHSLEHFRDPLAAVRAAAKLLATDGTMFIAVPDWGSMPARTFQAAWFHLDVPRHLFHFTSSALQTLTDACGLKLEKAWHTELEFDLFGWTQSALNRVSRPPNQLFSMMMGRPTQLPATGKLLQLGLGSAATLAALPLYAASVAAQRAGVAVRALRPI